MLMRFMLSPDVLDAVAGYGSADEQYLGKLRPCDDRRVLAVLEHTTYRR